MAVQFQSFSSFTKFNDYLAANPVLVLEHETYERHNEQQPQTFRQSIVAKLWTPPANAVAAGYGPRSIAFDALSNVGTVANRWWTKGAGDTGTVNDLYNPAGDNPAGKGPNDIYVGAAPTSSNNGNGRTWKFGGSGALALDFDELALHFTGDCKNANGGTNMIVAVYGILPSGGYHLLKTFVSVVSGGGDSDNNDQVEIVTAAEPYIGVRIVTANLANGTDAVLNVLATRRDS